MLETRLLNGGEKENAIGGLITSLIDQFMKYLFNVDLFMYGRKRFFWENVRGDGIAINQEDN